MARTKDGTAWDDGDGGSGGRDTDEHDWSSGGGHGFEMSGVLLQSGEIEAQLRSMGPLGEELARKIETGAPPPVHRERHDTPALAGAGFYRTDQMWQHEPPPQGQPAQPYGPPGPLMTLAQLREEEGDRMYALVRQSRAIENAATPPQVCELFAESYGRRLVNGQVVQTDQGITLWRDEFGRLPPHLLMLFSPSVPSLFFHDGLLRHRVPRVHMTDFLLSPHSESPWSPVIEPNPLLRFLTTWCWARWYHWIDTTAAALSTHPVALAEVLAASAEAVLPQWRQTCSLGIGFRHCGKDNFTPRHAKLYTRIWQHVSDFLINRHQLEAQTCLYANVDHCPPFGSTAHRQLVLRAARTIYCTNGENDYRCYEHYRDFLARESCVPRVLVQARLLKESAFNSATDLLSVTQWLCDEFDELKVWRRQLADRWHMPPEQLGLWLLEPVT